MLRTEPRVEAAKAQAGEMGIYLARPTPEFFGAHLGSVSAAEWA